MTTASKTWFAMGQLTENRLACASCGGLIATQEFVGDHHPRYCPVCGKECLFFVWDNVLVQVVLELAPAVVQRVIRNLQEELDELDFVELVVQLEGMAKGLQEKPVAMSSAQRGFNHDPR